MPRFEPDPNFETNLEASLAPLIEESAKRRTEILRNNVSGQGRSGLHHRGLPFRSSAAGVPAGRNMGHRVPMGAEFPTEQRSMLVSSAGAQSTNDRLKWRSGFFGDRSGKLLALEFGSVHVPARAPLRRTQEADETHREALEAMREAVR